jgi:hypothetical protein
MSFEKYLIKKDYIPYRRDKKQNLVKIQDKEVGVYSSMQDVCHFYIKDDKQIIIGLSEYKLPPVLIYPRPCCRVVRDIKRSSINIKALKNFSKKAEISYEQALKIQNEYDYSEKRDMNITAVFQNFSYDEIYEAMFDKTKRFNLDLTK